MQQSSGAALRFHEEELDIIVNFDIKYRMGQNAEQVDGVADVKTGRNAPCPCGSGRKYKKCCLLRENPRVRATPIPHKAQAAIQAMMEAEQNRIERFGEIRPVIHSDFQGYKFVAVGSDLHYSMNWKTFPDFLQYYIKKVLGPDWGKAELAKPLESRHEIMKWYDAMCRFQKKQERGPDGLFGVVPNGPMRAYLLLAYDLYILRHHSAVQESVVRRLKHPDQFQGARHELFATATCIRAGYDITFEDETDPSRRHAEFTATHKVTRQEITVEAKSRHRPGVLGHPGTPRTGDELRAGINRLLRDAFDKPASHPYVIFFDLNLPPSPVPMIQEPWFNEIAESVERVAKEKGDRDPFNLIVFTNQPDHYGEHDSPAPSGNVLSVLSQRPKNVSANTNAIAAIHHAAEQYGTLPNSFEEAG